MVEVVNMNTCEPAWGQPGDVRIDRATKWGNPFLIKHESDRDWVCEQYEAYFPAFCKRQHISIVEIANAKRLGCWCKPKRCHGDYLKKLIDELNRGEGNV
jgi:hypothetical protein